MHALANYICAIAICMRACMWQIMLLLVTELKIQVADGTWMVRRQQLSNYSSKQRVSDSTAGTTESRLDMQVTHKTARFVTELSCYRLPS